MYELRKNKIKSYIYLGNPQICKENYERKYQYVNLRYKRKSNFYKLSSLYVLIYGLKKSLRIKIPKGFLLLSLFASVEAMRSVERDLRERDC